MKRIMKNILIILTVVFFLGCKSQKQNFKGEKLPAYHTDIQTFKSVMNSSKYEEFQKLLVNDIEYSFKELNKILDTISKNYTMDIKIDSISNKKLLIIKSS